VFTSFYYVQTQRIPGFAATLGEEPEGEVALR
jgi:hypothetical protein